MPTLPAPTPSALRALARRDPVLGRALRRLARRPAPTPTAAPLDRTHFNALARAILYQQLAGRAAATIHGRVCALTPGPGVGTPNAFLALSDARLRAAGLSRNKLRALRDLAQQIADGRLRLGRAALLPDEVLIERLVAVRGIGVWSAQMFLMGRLGRLDVLPSGDLGVREGLRRLDQLDARPTPAALLERGEVWRPLRSVASRVLWRLADETVLDA